MTLTANPLNASELILFGGEHYNGRRCTFYNELFRYNTDKHEWRRISSPTSPGPRSAHQAVATPTGQLYVFGGACPQIQRGRARRGVGKREAHPRPWRRAYGATGPSNAPGEFASASENQFFHYKDFWFVRRRRRTGTRAAFKPWLTGPRRPTMHACMLNRVLDLASNQWQKLDVDLRPSPRSASVIGHA